jgi:hypothetical protein
MLVCRKAPAGRSFAYPAFVCLALFVLGVWLEACSSDDSAAPPAEPILTLDASFSYDGGAPDAAPDATVTGSNPMDASTPDATVPVEAAADVTVPVDVAVPVDAGADAQNLDDVGVPDTSLVEEAGIDAANPVDAGSEAAGLDAGNDAEGGHVYTDIGALSFAGSDAGTWVHLPAAAGGASTTAYSVELWFETKVSDGNMFEVYDEAGGADRFLSMNGGTVCFYVYSPAVVQVCSSATYDDGAWHHAAGTLGTNGVNVYVDGALAGSSTAATTSAFSAGSDFRLGMGHQFFVSPIVYFTGELDEVRLWSVERSASDIAANYSREVDPASPGLQGYWHLDETGAASTTADATGNGNDGTLMNFTYDPSPWVQPGAF